MVENPNFGFKRFVKLRTSQILQHNCFLNACHSIKLQTDFKKTR